MITEFIESVVLVSWSAAGSLPCANSMVAAPAEAIRNFVNFICVVNTFSEISNNKNHAEVPLLSRRTDKRVQQTEI